MEQDQDKNSKNPQHPSKPMDSEREVEQSNDAKIDQDFPGYPHYPAKEDIMDQRTDAHRVDVDVENLASGGNATGVNQRFIRAEESKKTNAPSDDDQEKELEMLNSKEAEIGVPQNISNEDIEDGGIEKEDRIDGIAKDR